MKIIIQIVTIFLQKMTGIRSKFRQNRGILATVINLQEKKGGAHLRNSNIIKSFQINFPLFHYLVFALFLFALSPNILFSGKERQQWGRESRISVQYVLCKCGEGNGKPFQYSYLENPMDGGAWRSTIHEVARVGQDLATKPPPPPYMCVIPITFMHCQFLALPLFPN